jgi:two-component system, OmpR family, manganese sensing sensor histidine kinase
MFNRSRRRIAYWFAVSMGSILMVFAGAVYYREVQDRLQAFDEALYRKSKAIASQGSYQLLVAAKDVPVLDSNPLLLDSELAYVRWYNAKGQLVKFFGGIPAPHRLTVVLGFQTIKTDRNSIATPSEKWLRQATLPVLQGKLLIGYLQVATPLTPIRENLIQGRLFLTVGVPVTLGLIGLTGWFLGGLAMQPIRRSYEQLQRFTADASHELRAPLAAILSNAQVGLLASVDDGAAMRYRLENIVKITKSMSALITNLLFLARHQGLLAPEASRNTELLSLLQPLINEYTAQAAEQSLSFISHLHCEPVSLSADPELLQQAVRNLLDNAFKYTPAGGTVDLRLFTQPRRAIIQVEDDGIGIPSADLPKIFDRFYRVDTARARQTGGFGLGLAIAQQIVEAHGGRITAKSEEGQGTTFQIELPQ